MLSFSDFSPSLRRRTVLAFGGFTAIAGTHRTAEASGVPPMMHARDWSASTSPAGWWVSEKYDGVRAWWDGSQLRTRRGNPISAPAWFTAHWPDTPMDGELWCGRRRFEQTVSTVRQRQAPVNAWHAVRYMVFDLPAQEGPFSERLAACARMVTAIGQRWVQAVPHERVADARALQERRDALVANGGEGLMLHHGDGLYQSGRSDTLRKYKAWDDAEAEVIGHLPGNGRHAGRVGALQVRTREGVTMRLGSGLNDAQRSEPPPLGSWVTYRYRGTTDAGVPRFATFLRPVDSF